MALDAQQSANLIDLAGTPQFGDNLLAIASSVAGVDEVFGYSVSREGTRPLVSASALADQQVRVSEYARRFYRQDPAIYEAKDSRVSRTFSQSISSQQIMQRDYRRICFEEPRFLGKSCFGWKNADYMLILNFYSRQETAEATFRDLSSLADLALAAISRRMKPRDEQELLDLFELRLTYAYPELTARERQVVARTLVGQNSGTIADELGTSKGTVLTYRQRAYQRFGFSNAAHFLSRLI